MIENKSPDSLTKQQKPMNLLIINVDQLRYDCISRNGNPIVKTPNIDRLAAEGMSFSSAYTPVPLCCPARQSFLSGVLPEKHGGLWNYDLANSMKALSSNECDVWVDQLRDAGYRTAYFGKWHVSDKEDPTTFGYESFQDQIGYPQSALGQRYTVENPGLSFRVGAYDKRPLEQTPTHLLTNQCLKKIEAFSQSETPWHIRLDFVEPHLPCLPSEPFASMYHPDEIPPWPNFPDSFEGKPFIQKQQLRNWQIQDWTWKEWSIYLWSYYGIISQVDHAVGNVLNYIDDHGLAENTLIVFTTDHGDAAGSHGMMDKHYCMYEEEVHVPMIIRWKQQVEAGSHCHDFISHFLDLPVTLQELLGLQTPDSYQGQSFAKQLQGKPNPDARSEIFSTYHGQQFGLYTQRMLRDRDFKYIWNATDVDEFYDMREDPYELKNLAEAPEHQERLASYRKRLLNCFDHLGDGMVQNEWMREQLSGARPPG